MVQLDPGNGSARAAVHRLKPVVRERQEKMKDEMIGARVCYDCTVQQISMQLLCRSNSCPLQNACARLL